MIPRAHDTTDQPRRNIENPKRRRIIERVGEEKEAIDLRGSDGVVAGDTGKRDVSRDAVRKTQQSDPHNDTEGSGRRSEGTCNEGESYGKDASNEEENNDSGSRNNENSDDDDEEEEDGSRSSGTEERCSEDNTQNTYRRTHEGTSDGRSEENNADKQLVLKEKANKGRRHILQGGRQRKDDTKVVKQSGVATGEENELFGKKEKDRLLRSVVKAFVHSTGKDAIFYPSEDDFFSAVKLAATLLGEDVRAGWGKHVEKKGLRNVLIECNRMMTTVRGELSWHLRHWFWGERGAPLVRGAQMDHNNTMRNELRCQMSKDKTWRRKDDEPWEASHFKRALTKVFQIRKDGEKMGVTLQQLAFTELVIRTEIEQAKKSSKASD
ncbi:hypothetical protein CBR_g30789 [Chara braunii]|uniref:Uncharacterized protein n=1 Tax=Chara braunii TaxID=69332 RepID=A0A388JXG9_CHABU|nr:hypothetical protein CBR_g30789 [Chara braunii]|eukprot:GBG62468.1 hypothetical protein CBR_g30789 [Chara braunii]